MALPSVKGLPCRSARAMASGWAYQLAWVSQTTDTATPSQLERRLYSLRPLRLRAATGDEEERLQAAQRFRDALGRHRGRFCTALAISAPSRSYSAHLGLRQVMRATP